MILDAHTHIFPPEIIGDRTRFAYPEETAFSGIYQDPRAKLAGAEELLAAMDQDGVDRAVIFGFPWVREDTARLHNDYVLESQNKYPDRLIGLACFDPLQTWAPREAVRALDAGLKGLGELAVYTHGFDQEAVARIKDLGQLSRERNTPLLLHVNEPIGHQYAGKAPLTIQEIYQVVQACRRVKLILAHWGGGLFFYNLLKKEVPEALADVYVDTAASPFLYRSDIYGLAARILGPEKILFGSDFPLIKPGRYFNEMEETSAGLKPADLALVKGEAAAKLFP
jgi:hypothetical protein